MKEIRDKKKIPFTNIETLFLGISVGVFATPIAIIGNVILGTFDTTAHATMGYLQVGFLFVVLNILYLIFIRNKYKCKIERVKGQNVE